MADAARADEILLRERFLKIDQFADTPPDLNLFPLVNGNARRVVAAILELLQPIQQNRHGFFIPDVPDNSTHGFSLPPLDALH
jgi:hypothetical protein